jgi:hypothetical protein
MKLHLFLSLLALAVFGLAFAGWLVRAVRPAAVA